MHWLKKAFVDFTALSLKRIKLIVLLSILSLNFHGEIADKMQRLENIKIKGRFDYDTILSISTEGRQKLKKINPETLAQASRIPGVSPSDVNVLLVLLKR